MYTNLKTSQFGILYIIGNKIILPHKFYLIFRNINNVHIFIWNLFLHKKALNHIKCM